MPGKRHHVHCSVCGAPNPVRLADFNKKFPYTFVCTNCSRTVTPWTIESLINLFSEAVTVGASPAVNNQVRVLLAGFSDPSDVHYGNVKYFLESCCALVSDSYNANKLRDVRLLIEKSLDANPLTTMEEILLVLNE